MEKQRVGLNPCAFSLAADKDISDNKGGDALDKVATRNYVFLISERVQGKLSQEFEPLGLLGAGSVSLAGWLWI